MTEDREFLVLIIQGLWAVLLIVLSVLMSMLWGMLKSMRDNFDMFYKTVLLEYPTKKDLQQRVHGLRGALGVHSTWIHLLAHVVKVRLPGNVPTDGDKEKHDDT